MKLLLCALLLAFFMPLFSFSQTIQTGYAVVTPTSGTGSGLSVSETFGELVGGNFFQASVIASPLVTLTNVVINSNPATGVNTGIAVVNPNDSPVNVTMTLGNQQGLTADTRTFTLGAREQVSKFITEFFQGNSLLQGPLTGLVFISSNLPVGVLGLAFTGFSFASLPVATQLTAVNVTPNTASNINNVNNVTTVVVAPTAGVQNGIAAAAATTPFPIIPSTILQLPSTFPSVIPTQVPTITTPITGIAPVTALLPVTTVVPLTGNSTALLNVTGQLTTIPTTVTVLNPSVLVFPQISLDVGGPGAQLLPQVATGAGWVTQITIANISGITQTVRVDFFNPFGSAMTLPSGATVANIVVPPTGVATVSAPAL
jgi:hypothetical protein